MKFHTINSKVKLFAALFGLLVVLQNTWTVVKTNENSALVRDYLLRISVVQQHAHDLKFWGKEIQQHLQDISATRALNGHDDGIDNARHAAVKFRQTITAIDKTDPALGKETTALLMMLDKYVATGEKMAKAYIEGGPEAGNKLMGSFDESSDEITAKLDELIKYTDNLSQQNLAVMEAQAKTLQGISFVSTLCAAALLLSLLWGGQRFIHAPLRRLAEITKILATADEHQRLKVDINSKDEVGEIANWINLFIDKREAELASQLKSADQNYALRKALDCCQANVMMADNDMHITYLNGSAHAMFKNAEADLRKDLPRFNADALVGTNADVFHKSPTHQRSLLENLRQPHNTRIKVAGRTFDLIATPVFNDTGKRIGVVIEWYDRTMELLKQLDEQRTAVENARVRSALDAVTANAMIADPDGNIIYANSAVLSMLRVAESDIRKELSNFSSEKVLGSNFDIFHRNPAHQRRLLEALSQTYRTEIKVGGRIFRLVANPVFDSAKNRIGSVVEWHDRTQEASVEAEINSVVEAAVGGDLSARLNVAGKEGFFHRLSEGLNRMLDVSEEVFTETARVLNGLANGDLTQTIDREYNGVYAQLKNDANTTVERLTETIQRIREAAHAVANGAHEIAQGNTDLSQRTEEQASSLEETASSMEEMTATVKQSADNAQQANEMAVTARSNAQRGGEVVSRAVQAMQEINASSKKIADIIGVIDEIAFQTNLLALNAAVEAARAGEQGRGFAVVAGEVRNLAQRSAAAAKEIKDLIRDSVNKVQDGTKLVNESGDTLKEIVSAVERVTLTMSEISSAAREQTAGIEQVNVAVSQLDEMTQQNAALVEEASAAGEAMSEQSRSLLDLISFFRTQQGNVQSFNRPSVPNMKKPATLKAAASGGRKSRPQDDDDEWQEF